jgi:hypothetical protein
LEQEGLDKIMSANNARIIEKDALNSIGSVSSDSAIIDLNGASKFSCQAIYDVTANPAAAVISTANITISSDPTHPSQFHKASHGFVTGLKVQATTAGTLAVPLALSTDYFVIKIDADYFALATSLANALAGTKIAITNVGVTSTTLTPVALSASVTFQKSNDQTNWVNIEAATAITVDGSVLLSQPNVSYRYFKVIKTLTAGLVDVQAFVLVIGDAI